MTHLSVA